MPYQSKAQMAYMHAKHPEIAKRWDKEYPQKELPVKRHRSSVKKAARQMGY